MPLMMTFDEFRQSLSADAPPKDADLALQGLWWSRKGDWDRAHRCVQQREGERDCGLVHAHLHRVEGDLSNAGYWYRSAGEKAATNPVEEEWAALVSRFLARG
jgi:hypothetical protein